MGLKNWKGPELEAAVKAVTERNMRKAVLFLEGKAKRTATDMGVVDTGRYRASITSAVSDGFSTSSKALVASDAVGNVEGKETLIRGVVGTNVEYAKAIEFGVHVKDTTIGPGRGKGGRASFSVGGMRARPVLRNSFEASKKKIRQIFGEETKLKF